MEFCARQTVFRGKKEMFRIAICDDDAEDLYRTRSIVESWQKKTGKEETSFSTFKDSQKLLESHKIKEYNLLILDIIMPQKTGIEMAREIRKKGDDTMVIYISATTNYAMEAFGIQALGYIEKPVDRHTLLELLDRAWLLYQATPKKTLNIISDRNPVQINISDIVYIENSMRIVIYKLRNGKELKVSRRSGSFEEAIKPVSEEEAFAQVHKSYFVNMRYIKSLQAQSVLMDDGSEVPVSKRKMAELREKYIEYTFRNGNPA